MKAERGNVFEWNKIENGPEVWKVEIKKSANSQTARTVPVDTADEGEETFVLNVTLLEPRLKHPTIFKHFDALEGGTAFQILNDHDPKPLYYHMIAERGNIFSWTYLEKGPQWWKVQIRKNDIDGGETIGEIAAKDLRKAEVFKKYGIDFCCGGKKTLKQVCKDKGVDIDVIEAELTKVGQESTTNTGHDFNRWQPDFLADYIYNQHHVYYYETEPVVTDLLAKVVARHGAHYPELNALAALYETLINELDSHFLKEEKVVFPFIKALMKAKVSGDFEALQSQPSLTEPIKMMESEHEAAGDILDNIRHLTNHYKVPSGGCNSFQFLYKKLKELDEDLQQHIHLENNLLFPKALKIEKELRNSFR
ncbi:MAG: iron-sulfur cluster repair di-iron protein [Chitinophagaceae bacterium]|nr:MAG: iron-sulfur cluster repair di-iron protein [Chitinophagaceae bacterium]